VEATFEAPDYDVISWLSLMLVLSRCEPCVVLRAVTSRRALDPRDG
jgi:hypothetical protein